MATSSILNPATGLPSLDGEYQWFGREREWKTAAGAVWRYMTNGGGGWGNPLEREPERVQWDVIEELVSEKSAREDYGVVLTRDFAIDHAATEALRTKMRAGQAA